jgi:hypothetical protein
VLGTERKRIHPEIHLVVGLDRPIAPYITLREKSRWHFGALDVWISIVIL